MIFVTVGTTAFNALIKAVDNTRINDQVIIQKSDGNYLPQNYKFFEFTDKINDYYEDADIIITHGGAGSIYKLLEMGKKIIGVANEERKDKHQFDILQKLSKDGYLVWCKDLNKLNQCIKKIKRLKLKKYTPPDCTIAENITEFLHTI